MTTEVTSANKVIVVGMLDTMLVRDRAAKRSEGRKMVEVTQKSGRDRGTGGRRQSLKLQVRSPFGGMFALPLEIEPDVVGAELLERAEAETMLTVEGVLQLVQTFDGRFASDARDARGRTDRGRPTRELQPAACTMGTNGRDPTTMPSHAAAPPRSTASAGRHRSPSQIT